MDAARDTLMTMESTSDMASVVEIPANPDALKHAAKVLVLMNEHRKSSKKLCDVTLRVGEKEVDAHRSVLAACSRYFLVMFNGELKESMQKVVTLKGVKFKVLEVLVEFAYTGLLAVTTDNVQPILAAASLLQFPEVCDICCQFLEVHLDASNCIGIRKFTEDHNCKSFLPVVDKFISENFIQVLLSEEFHMLPFRVLQDLVASADLNVSFEEQAYNAIVKWARFNTPERGYLFPKLLANIRLPLLPPQFVMNSIEVDPLVRTSLECRDLIDEAKNYHLQPDNQAKLRSARTIPRKSTTGFLFAVGGKEAGEAITEKCERYSMFSNSWTSVCSLNLPRQQLGVCQLKNKIYAIAGSDGANRLNTAEIYHLEKDTWEYMAPLKICRSGVGVGVLGEAIYALGGYDGRICVESVERYDSEVGLWDFVAPLRHTRSFPGVAVHGGRMYVVGGNDGTNFLSSCEVYDPLTNRWSFIAPMHRPRAGIGAAVVDGILYAAGGFDGVRRLDLVERYEPRTNSWTNVASMRYCRDGVSLARYGSWLYAVGGIDGPSYLNCVEFYDPLTDRWDEVAPMETSRAAAGVAVLMDHTVIEV